MTAAEERYWARYLDHLRPLDVVDPRVTAGPAGHPEITDGLVALYLDGTKTAGSSLAEDFVATHDPLPQVGDHWIVLASDGEPRCILRTERIETFRFEEVSEEIAAAEGEGDRSVASWKRAHADRYAPHLGEWGVADIDEATVVAEFFQVVFRQA